MSVITVQHWVKSDIVNNGQYGWQTHSVCYSDGNSGKSGHGLKKHVNRSLEKNESNIGFKSTKKIVAALAMTVRVGLRKIKVVKKYISIKFLSYVYWNNSRPSWFCKTLRRSENIMWSRRATTYDDMKRTWNGVCTWFCDVKRHRRNRTPSVDSGNNTNIRPLLLPHSRKPRLEDE